MFTSGVRAEMCAARCMHVPLEVVCMGVDVAMCMHFDEAGNLAAISVLFFPDGPGSEV